MQKVNIPDPAIPESSLSIGSENGGREEDMKGLFAPGSYLEAEEVEKRLADLLAASEQRCAAPNRSSRGCANADATAAFAG